MKDIKQQHYFKNIDKYYYRYKSNSYYNFNKIDYSNINNYCYYNKFKNYKLSAGRLNVKYNLKSGRRLNKNFIQFLSYIKPIVLFNDIKKFKGREYI